MDDHPAEAGHAEAPSGVPGEAHLAPLHAKHGGLDPDAAYLRSALEQARKVESSTWTTSMMVVSPVSLMFLVFAILGGVESILWALVFAVALVVQLARWKRAEREVARLERTLADHLSDGIEDAVPGPSERSLHG